MPGGELHAVLLNPTQARYLTINGGAPTSTEWVSAARIDSPDGALYRHLHATVIDPGLQKGIDYIRYSYEIKYLSSASQDIANTITPLLFQDNTWYSAPLSAAMAPRQGDWVATDSNGPLSAASFTVIEGGGPAHPDFSITGKPIQFGYLATARDFVPGNPPPDDLLGVRDWQVSIAVPAPTAFTGAGGLLAGGCLWQLRRRRNRD